MERQHSLLLGRLDCREPHRRATDSFANRFRIESIALTTFLNPQMVYRGGRGTDR